MALQETQSKLCGAPRYLIPFHVGRPIRRLALLGLCLLLSSCFSTLEHEVSEHKVSEQEASEKEVSEQGVVGQTSNATEQPNSLRVISSGGFAAAYNLLEPIFEKRTGIDLQTSYGSSSGGAPDSIPVRLAEGQQFDVLIMSKGSLNKMTERGDVYPDTHTDLVRSMIGMAVKEGAPKQDISTPEKFIEVLMQAKSIGYSASASGRYLSTKLWPKMGIWETIQIKSKRILSERVATVVARGEVEIGFQQISEILPIEGADYVGPIPQELQKVTTFSTAITTRASNPEDAKRLIEFLSSIEIADIISNVGLVPVVLENTRYKKND